MIDKEAFRVRYNDFDNEIVIDILDMFISGYDENIKTISAAISNDDLPSVKKAAHAFKGIIGNIESNCKAFTEIERIETMSDHLIQLDFTKGIEEDEDYKEALMQVSDQFLKFKNSSKQLLEEAIGLKQEYQD
jgi:HPt (histidine-containing phosphotransfer) domain-containing protein